MSSNFEKIPGGKTPRERLAALDAERAELLRLVEKEDAEARDLARNDVYLEHDPVAQEAASTGKTRAGEPVSDLKSFLMERRQWLINNPPKGSSGPRRAEDLPRETRADDPEIWRRGTGNR